MTLTTVFGGTGFLGRRIVERLARDGATVRVAARHPDRIRISSKSVGLDRIIPIAADVRNSATVTAAIAGADSVVNAVSAYVETGDITYTAIHVDGAANIARASQQQNVARLIHISGMGANPSSPSPYIRARGLGERVAQKEFPSVTIVRPSVMFAADGGFLNIVQKVARSAPIIPLIGGGLTKLQPVHVGDIAEAVDRLLLDPDTAGKTYELGGAETYSFREIFDLVLAQTGGSRWFFPVPLAIAYPLARALEFFPGAPLTVAQVDLLKDDNIRPAGTLGFEELGITPQKLRDTISQMPRAQ